MGASALSSSVEIDFDDFDGNNSELLLIYPHLKAHSRCSVSPFKNTFSHGLFAGDEVSVIYGAPGSTKSALAIDIACRAAVGMDWSGGYTAPIVGVVYVAAERVAQVRRRADAFCRHHGLERLDNLIIYDGPIDLVRDRGLLAATILSAGSMVQDGGIYLVVIDTLAAAMSASDSSPDAMAAVVSTINRSQRVVRDEWGEAPHIMLLHHTPASGEARLRGGGQLLGTADITLHVSQRRGLATAQVEKNNDSPDRPALSYGLDGVVIGQDPYGMDVTAPVVVPHQEGPEKKAPRVSRAQRDAIASLQAAMAANDNRPVTEEQWRSVVFTAAGDLSPDGKRMKFKRHQQIVAAGMALEIDGLFALPEPNEHEQNRTNVRT
ncbi:AAA family ATPase [Roseixanthobacter pseudopolyaromaticivorans]|uniref:AAA family ATPase n=1 Tax=Xanthobacteraceae TaxID=335928 RepID=UPI0037295951